LLIRDRVIEHKEQSNTYPDNNNKLVMNGFQKKYKTSKSTCFVMSTYKEIA